MKYLILFLLCSCGSPNYDKVTDYGLPPELVQCKIYRLKNGTFLYKELFVIKCPNEQPTMTIPKTCGKNCTEHISTKITY